MKNSFVFYADWWQQVIAGLNDTDRLKCFDAICKYAFTGELPTDPYVKALTGLMRSALDRDTEKYEHIKQVRKEAIEKRWRSKGDTTDTKNTKVYKSIFCNTDNVNGNGNGNDNDNGNGNDNDINNVPAGTCVSLSAEASDFQKLQNWINKELGHVAKIEKQLTEKELDKLLSNYDKNEIFDTLKDLDNYHRNGKPVEKCYTSVYITLRNWLKKNNKDN